MKILNPFDPSKSPTLENQVCQITIVNLFFFFEMRALEKEYLTHFFSEGGLIVIEITNKNPRHGDIFTETSQFFPQLLLCNSIGTRINNMIEIFVAL